MVPQEPLKVNSPPPLNADPLIKRPLSLTLSLSQVPAARTTVSESPEVPL